MKKMISISTEEISDKMFFVRVEDRNLPIAVIKVADLLEKLVKNDEYKDTPVVRIEIIEHHTFAKPEQVRDIDFPSSTSSEDK